MYNAVKWKLISLAVPMVQPIARKTHMRVIIGYPFCHSYTSVCAALCSMNRRLSIPAVFCSMTRRLLHTLSVMLHKLETIEHHAPQTGN